MAKRKLAWGTTPWTKMPRAELEREVHRFYSALLDARDALTLLNDYGNRRLGDAIFFSPHSTGGLALAKADEALGIVHKRCSKVSIYRMFFRYADDLLFETIGRQWAICSTCGTMIGSGRGEPPPIGEPCPDDAGHGAMRALTWGDLVPSKA